MPRDKEGETSILKDLGEFIQGVLKALSGIEAHLKKSLENHKRALQGWLVKVIVTGLSVFMSLAFLILGLFFIVIDYGGVPRGVVFTGGGFLGLLVLGLRVNRK